ncbi:MAG: DUF2851 family protein [Draconibacterium sp.]
MNTPSGMPEEFLQYVWENRLFDSGALKTSTGEPIEIIHPGRKNTDSGPDFFNARIKLGDTVWAGNIEIHVKASDWNKHLHQNDKAYDNVVLHVVETFDTEIARTNGETIPTLILTYPDYLRNNYQSLLDAKTWIACENRFHRIDPILLQLGFNRLMIGRLESKTEAILARLEQNNNDWNETFYQVLARSFGFKVNAVPFELLARSLPASLLTRHKNNQFQLEALLFGNSGLLNHQLLGDDYYLKLREEYSFLYKKYELRAIESHLWKFLRLRPVNFPPVRISQLAALFHRSEALFSNIIEPESLSELYSLFRVRASEYWDTHYNFNKPSKSKQAKELGETSIQILIINVVIPFLFVYGEKQNKNHLKNRALEFLEQLPAEANSVVAKWAQLGINARSAFESQALLQLKSQYCEAKKCLNCQVGVKLVSERE